jgi:hypothetical protein
MVTFSLLHMMQRFFLSILLGFLLVPSAFAQELTIQFQTPEDLEIDEEVIVTIEVSEGSSPVGVEELSVSYLPADGVFDEVVYDCNDSAVQDNCRANNRGVPGVFEAVFDLKKLPLTVMVDADGVQKSIQLTDSAGAVQAPAAIVLEEPAEVEVMATESTEAVQQTSTGGPVITPENIQVGPAPSWLITLMALGLMCFVVSYFVVKTTD